MKATKRGVEIERTVRLTAGQKIKLIQAKNNGGRFTGFDHRDVFIHLGLLSSRKICNTPRLRREVEAKVRGLWVEVAGAVAKKDTRLITAKIYEISRVQNDLEDVGYFLTKEADLYLANGRVVITA